MRRLLLAVLLLAGCAGEDPYRTCVDHSVDEGVAREAAEAACTQVVER